MSAKKCDLASKPEVDLINIWVYAWNVWVCVRHSMAQGTLSATRNKLAAEKDASKESGGLPNSGVQIRPPGSEVQTQAPDSGVRILPPDNDVEILPDTSEEVLFPPSKPGRTMQESPNKETQTHKEEKTPGAELQKTMDSSKNKVNQC